MRQTIAYFTGLDERLGPLAGDASAARSALNLSTDYGRLASAPGAVPEIDEPVPCLHPTRLTVFSDRIEGQTFHYVVVGGKEGVYAHKNGAWQAIFEGESNGDWGFLTYQKGENTLLLFGDGLSPVQVWDGETAQASPLPGAPGKGRFFALNYERVWMGGDIEHPDRLYYSRAMDVENWTPSVEIPDQGGGFVELPTFDGGETTGIYKVGGDLCILKSTTALLLYGSSPASYQVMEMTGNLGTIAGRSAAVLGQSGFFLTSHGIGVQSGTALSLLDDRKLPWLFDPGYGGENDGILRPLGAAFGRCAAGIAHNERLYFTLPLGEDEQNSLLLEYDAGRQHYMLHSGAPILSLCKAGAMRERLLALTADGRVLAWGTAPHSPYAPALWQTPWLDFGTNRLKTLCGASLFGKVFSGGRHAAVKLVIESEKGRKSRILSPRRGGDELYRFVFRLPGRRFRLKIESVGDTGFCFTGGLEMEVN
ncbi:MAG: hypothetical protein LBD02_01945 [Christensenellaceae bacterium]|jgi:hypothetical protein|nr:hypothetical protein [Christensenellaceae bacterium]